MLNGSGYHVALFSTIAWCLWQRRNCLRENQSTWLLREVGDRAKALVMNFFESHYSAVGLTIPTLPIRWSWPLESFYKANIDVAKFKNLGCAGTRVAIKDSVEEIIVALSQRIHLPHSSEMAKAMAVRRAVVFARELSLFEVVVEGDCLQVVTTLNASDCYKTMYGNVIRKT